LLTGSERQAVFDLLQLGREVDEQTSLALGMRHVAALELLVDGLLEKILLLRVARHFHHLTRRQPQQLM